MVDETRLGLLKSVADAARRYRATMRRYVEEQARLLDQGVPIDELFARSQGAFTEVAEAEEALDDALIVLEWYESSARASSPTSQRPA